MLLQSKDICIVKNNTCRAHNNCFNYYNQRLHCQMNSLRNQNYRIRVVMRQRMFSLIVKTFAQHIKIQPEDFPLNPVVIMSTSWWGTIIMSIIFGGFWSETINLQPSQKPGNFEIPYFVKQVLHQLSWS